MKIIIAASLYPPEIGGPSFYAESLKNSLEKMGHTVDVVLYGNLKKLPPGIKHLLYALKLYRATKSADAVIGLDTFSIVIPLGLIAPFLHIPALVRAGGDFVWEQYNARAKDFIPLPDFYRYTDRWTLKEKISFRLIRFALTRLQVVFSSAWQRDLWIPPYRMDSARVHIIENAIPPRVEHEAGQWKNFMMYGRQIQLKNADAFRRAFERARKHTYDIVLEEGTVSHEELLEKLRTGYAAVLPSISDITPNYIIESICRGTPFLLTKYSAYAVRFKDLGVIVDPMSEDDMVRGIRDLLDKAVYTRLTKNIAAFTEVRTYDDIAREFLALLKR
ncbi:MAG TPA: glycosyltransferase family 4 protein [Candidatus Paceibacterota bacterium]